jgi:hypothetical protein
MVLVKGVLTKMEYTSSTSLRKGNGVSGNGAAHGNGHHLPLNGGASPKDGRARRAFQHDLPVVLAATNKRIAALEGDGHVHQHDSWDRGRRPDVKAEIDRLVRFGSARRCASSAIRNGASGAESTAISVSAARLLLWPSRSTAWSIDSSFCTYSKPPMTPLGAPAVLSGVFWFC